MHNNYYFLRKLSAQLKEQLIGFRIVEVFSQLKNELIISLEHGAEYKYIKAHLDPAFCCLSFPENFSRARKNSVDLFPQIINHKIIDILQFEQDRSFYLQISGGFQLLFKMYGNRSNIILLKKMDPIHVFKNNLKQDFGIKINDLNRKIDLTRSSFERVNGNYNEWIPTFGNAFDLYFQEKKYATLSLEDKYHCINNLFEYLKEPDFYIHEEENSPPQLRLYKIHDEDLCYQSPIDALNIFYRRYNSIYRVTQEKALLRNSLNAQIRKSESYILKTNAQLEKLGTAASYRHIGDMIMANLHLIKPHTGEITLIDFYTQEPVKIALKSTLSPQRNAEKYYKKSKKQQMEIDALKRNIDHKKTQIEALEKQLRELDLGINKNRFEKEVKIKPPKEDPPYHSVSFMDFEILIGKNAKKNERLTFHTAKKDDLFLHAKDVPGSHVIIRNRSNQNFPLRVIEKAAAFAAFYSKNKSVSLCSVLYTPKKYVRKAKGAPAGTVLVEREKVILVKPEKLVSN